MITGGAGAGKTHVACALCVTALHQMRTVKYIRANYLLQESAHAHSEDNYYEYSNKMAGYDLLVIDDLTIKPQLILLSRHFCTQICSEKLLDGGV